MANRKRKFVLRVPVTPEERALIQQKMAQLGTKNFSAYARKMLIDGYIVHIDTGPVPPLRAGAGCLYPRRLTPAGADPWGSPQTPERKDGEEMANRKRKFVLRVPVTPEERALIQEKMAQLGTKNFSAYARKMLIDGYVIHMDTGDIRAQTAELQKIGVNVNQIARRINSTGTVYAQDVEDIKGALAQIWQLQRYILSSQR